MIERNQPRKKQPFFTLLGLFIACLFLPARLAEATVFDWDNYSGSSAFIDSFNWRPTGGPPGVGDTALFDGQLESEGIGNNAVHVPAGTVIDAMQISNSSGFPATTVDMTIGDGTTASRFDLDQFSNPLVIGTSYDDTATLNLLGGWLDTFGNTTIGGRATFNVVGEGSYWDSANVFISGDTVTNTAGIGLGNQATIRSYGSLYVGSDTGSGRVVVDGWFTGFGTPSLWTVTSSVDIGPTSTSGFNFGSVTLKNNGQMDVGMDVDVHGTGSVSGTLTVQTGGALDVASSLNIGPFGVLELFNPASTITTGDIDNNGGTLDWTGGTLHITDGRLRIDDSAFADLELSSLTVDSGMTLKVTRATGGPDSLTIGNVGTGLMAVQNGGVVESYHGFIGEASNAVGSVSVDGAPSRWSVAEDLSVGNTGTGEGWLSITDGGQVEANSIWLGRADSTQGVVYVFGANSTLTSHAVLAVGGFIPDSGSGGTAGGTGTLYMESEGRVEVEGTLKVWGAGTVMVDVNGGTIRADTIDLAPGATFTTNTGTLIEANALVGFGNNASFAGNLQLGHSGGSAYGSHTVAGGQTLTVDQDLAIGTDAIGTLWIRGGTVSSGNSFIGGGVGPDGSVVSINGPGSFWYANQIYVGGDGFAAQAGGALDIANDGQAIVSDRIKVWGPGTVALDSGVISTDFVEVEGLLMGNGAILLGGGPTAVINRGFVMPGLSVGVLTINGNASTADAYVQETSGKLIVEIGGTSPSRYDRLDIVAGSASLGGLLEVWLIDPLGGSNTFVPKAGDSFEILTADHGLGGTTFDTQSGDLPTLSGALFWEIFYGSDLVRLDVFTPFTADFDRDGDVDDNDLAQWSGDFGLNGNSDADGDGDSDGGDFLAWQRQYGSGVGPISNSTAVPEPTGLVLALMAAFGLGGFRHAGRKQSPAA